MTYHRNHITSRALLQNKVRRFYLLSFCNFYVASRAFAIGTISYLRTSSHNIYSVISFYYPLKEAFTCIIISTKVRETTPAKPHLYGTSRMSSVEPVSRKSTRKVGRGQLSSNNAADRTNTWKGDNYRLNANTINVCSNRTSILRIDRL